MTISQIDQPDQLGKPATAKPPVCITGMHRSGTSMITRMLNLCGLYIGQPEQMMPAHEEQNPKGFWEVEEIRWINEDLLNQLGGSWDQPPAHIPDDLETLPDLALVKYRAQQVLSNFAGQESWGWKDPRTCLTLPFWYQLIGRDLRVVVCLRNPLNSASSLKARKTPVRFGYHLWKTYYQQLMQHLHDLKLPYIVTHYDSYFVEPQAELRRVVEFLDLKVSDTELHEASQFKDSGLRKQGFSDLDLLKSEVPLDIIELYLKLSEEAGPVYQRLRASQPTAQQALFLSADLEANKADILALRLESTRSELAATRNTLDEVRQELEVSNARIEYFSQALPGKEQHIENLEKIIENLREVEESQRHYIEGLHDEEGKTRQHVVNLQKQLESLETSRKTLNRQLFEQRQELQQQVTQLQQELHTSRVDNQLFRERAYHLEQELQAALDRLQQYEQIFGGANGTRIQKAVRGFGQVAFQLQQSLAVTSNLLAAPLVRTLTHKGQLQGNLDYPATGAALAGQLEVKGWAVSSAGPVQQVEVWLDDTWLGEARYGLRRPDVLSARPWQWQLECGFEGTFSLDKEHFKPGQTKNLKIVISDSKENRQEFSCPVLIESVSSALLPSGRVDETYQEWIKRNEPTPWDLEHQRGLSLKLAYQPRFSIICPVYNTPEAPLRAMIQSVINQTYPHWELCMVDGASALPHVRPVLEAYAAQDVRIRLKFLDHNLGISGNSNAAIEMAQGEFLGLLDHDDELAPNALYENALLLNMHPQADMIYSDEDKIDEQGRRCLPFFKPDWSPDLFNSVMYTCHFGVYRTALLREIDGFRRHLDGAQDHDLVLRLTEKTDRIYHIPCILYHWRMLEGSTALSGEAKGYADAARIRLMNEHLERSGIKASVEPGLIPNSMRLRYRLTDTAQPTVSIIIPTRDQAEVLKTCIDSILAHSTYQNYQIVIVDNNSAEPPTLAYFETLQTHPKVRILSYPHEFNFSAINNFAVSQVDSDLVLFLNNDTEVIAPQWLEAMIEHALRPEIGAVGARLLYPNGTVQHAGVIMGMWGVAEHAHKGLPAKSAGYFGLAKLIQNCSAVTAACLMVRTDLFREAGGFNETNLPIAFNDIDFCLRLRERGLLNLYTPYAELYHHESLSRGSDETPERKARFQAEINYMVQRWASVITNDPYYNPNLALEGEEYALAPVSRYVRPDLKLIQAVSQTPSPPPPSVGATPLKLGAEIEEQLPYHRKLSQASAAGEVLHRENIYGSGPPSPAPSPEVMRLIAHYQPTSVLDVGSGIGVYVQGLLDLKIPAQGLEVNPEYVAQAQALGRPVQLYDGHKLPFADGEFDTVMAIEVLEHIPEWDKVLLEMLRVARRQVLISVPNIGVIPAMSRHLVVPWHLLEATHLNFFTQDIMTKWLAQLEGITSEVFTYGAFQINGEIYHNHVFAVITRQSQPVEVNSTP